MSNWKPTELTNWRFQIVNPSEIITIPECQPRVDGTDDSLVAEYAEDMRTYDAQYADRDPKIYGWQKFPHIQCVHDEDVGYILFSGYHRLDAVLSVGYPEIDIYVADGARSDAIVLSKKENARSGKRRSNADKAHVVKSCLLDDELRLWSDRQIAEWCGVDHKTVAKYEESLGNFPSENGEPYTRPARRKRLSKSGNIEWINTAGIGNSASEIKQAKIDHSNARLAVQSAFFDTNLHKRMDYSPTGKDTRLKTFFAIIVKVKDLRVNIFSDDYYWEKGNNLELSEIQAEIEVLRGEIAKGIRFYMQGDDCHLGWMDAVLSDEAFVVAEEVSGKTPTNITAEQAELEAKRDLAQDAEAKMWGAYTEANLEAHISRPEFEREACKAHPNWGMKEFPDITESGVPAIWEGRFDLIRTEIGIPSAWIQAILGNQDANTVPETSESDQEQTKAMKVAQKAMWQALWAKQKEVAPQNKGVHANNFITAACNVHRHWGVSSFPRNELATDEPEVWTERYKLITEEIKQGLHGWLTGFLKSEYSDLGAEILEFSDYEGERRTPSEAFRNKSAQKPTPEPEKEEQVESQRLAIQLDVSRNETEEARTDLWYAFDGAGLSEHISPDDFVGVAAKQFGWSLQASDEYNDPDTFMGEGIKKLSLQASKVWLDRFTAIKDAIEEKAEWVEKLIPIEPDWNAVRVAIRDANLSTGGMDLKKLSKKFGVDTSKLIELDNEVAIEHLTSQKARLYQDFCATPLAKLDDNEDIAFHQFQKAAYKEFFIDEALLDSDDAKFALPTPEIWTLARQYVSIKLALEGGKQAWIQSLMKQLPKTPNLFDEDADDRDCFLIESVSIGFRREDSEGNEIADEELIFDDSGVATDGEIGDLPDELIKSIEAFLEGYASKEGE